MSVKTGAIKTLCSTNYLKKITYWLQKLKGKLQNWAHSATNDNQCGDGMSFVVPHSPHQFHLIEQKWEHFITKRLDKTFWEPCFKTAVMSCFFLRLHKLLDKLLCQGFVYTNGLTSVLLNLHLRKTLFAESAKNVNIAETTVTYLVIYSIKE